MRIHVGFIAHVHIGKHLCLHHELHDTAKDSSNDLRHEHGAWWNLQVVAQF